MGNVAGMVGKRYADRVLVGDFKDGYCLEDLEVGRRIILK
jgi:hypothetical protein